MKRVTEAEYLQDYKILITFNNGVKKIVDMKNDLWGTMFEPLKDKNLFEQFRVDKDIHTIVWPNGADFSPDSLYNIGKPIRKKRRVKSKQGRAYSDKHSADSVEGKGLNYYLGLGFRD